MPNDTGATARKKRPDKQRTSRGASFKRMAKEMRREAKANNLKYCLPIMARILDAEAARLRAMP